MIIKDNIISLIKILLVVMAILVSLLLLPGILSGCKTYKPVWIDTLPNECNMSLNVYKIYYTSTDKSATVPITQACIKKLHREYCKKEVFGEAAVDYNDSVKYRNFEQCLDEIK